jgi:hypothetical protein
MRTPYAAQVLSRQVTDGNKRAKLEPTGDPDGFGVLRSLKVDKNTSKTLGPQLELLNDPRIESLSDEDGHLIITFVASGRADHRDEFPLEAAATIHDG